MKILKRVLVLSLVAMFFTVIFSSCNGEKDKDSNPTTTTTPSTTAPTIPNVIDLDVATLLTKEEVSEIFGVSMNGPEVLERGESTNFTSDDGLNLLTVSVEEMTREEFDTSLSEYSDLIDAPNLAESAKWSKENKILIAYVKKYHVLFYLEHEKKSGDDLLLLSRQLAIKAVDRIK